MVTNQRRTIHQRASHQPFYHFCGGVQLFLDLRQAFDCVNRSKFFSHLGTLAVNQSIVAILGEWHSSTSYAVPHANDEIVVNTGRGVRQGCRAAPLLWNALMHKGLIQLAEHTSDTWVKRCVTLFADDFHAADAFTSPSHLNTILSYFGVLLDVLADLELEVSLEKSHILISMAGHRSRQFYSRYVQMGRHGPYIQIPRRGGQFSALPIKTSAVYLGVTVSYKHLERQTFERRMQSANLTHHRLRRWLRSTCIPLKSRLLLWRSSVLATLHYGLIAVNFTLPILSRHFTLVMGMHRRIVGDHSFRTHATHTQALHHFQLEHPFQLLLRHVQQCADTQGHRMLHIAPTDIMCIIDWSHLHQNAQLIHTAIELHH